jgi:hypothetical protein
MNRLIQKSDDSSFLDKGIFTNQLLLPNEVLNTILEYQGFHSWVKGKYISRLNINDEKYDKLKNLKIIKKDKNTYKATITKMKNHYLYKYILEQKICNNMVHWYMKKLWYHSIHRNKKTYDKPYVYETHYVFGKNKIQNLPMLPIDYTYKK